MTFQLNIEQGTLLVKLARKAVETYLKNGTIMDVPKEIPRSLMENYGVFVTLNSTVSGEKELRGCIGFPYPTEPLAKAVIEAAVSSATQDPRFSPVSLKELESIVFELSILTSPQPVKAEKATDYPSKIKIKRDGLIVEKGYCKGLLLPQVPVEWKWNEEEFLCQCCVKAGLSPDSWLLKGTKIYTFSCIIAQETKPNGDITITDMRQEP